MKIQYLIPFTLLLIPEAASAHLNPLVLTDLAPTSISENTVQYKPGQSQTLSGNSSWYDAADNGGDSHKGEWYIFNITNTNGALIDFNVTGTNVTSSGSLIGSDFFKPAFTIYEGALPAEVHDGATYEMFFPEAGDLVDVYKEGVWQSLADTTMGNDEAEIGTINYITHAGENNLSNVASIENLFLEQGTYTVAVGGSCVDCASPGSVPENYEIDFADILNNLGLSAEELWWLTGPRATNLNAYQFNTSLSIQPVPVPAALWLFGTALFSLTRVKNNHNKSLLNNHRD